MLAFYHRLSLALQRWRGVLISLTLLSGCGFLALLFVAEAGVSQRWQLSSAFLTLVCLLLVLLSLLFTKPALHPQSGQSLWQRFVLRLRLAASYLLALFITLLILALLWLGLRTLTGIIADLYFS